MALPIIAIVGRPNVGKSTLFNRLIGERYSITSEFAGTTRDRVYHEGEMGSYKVILVDTGGLDFDAKASLEGDVQMQARIAVSEAHLILFVIDATEGLTATDYDAVQLLRKSKKPIVLIANKTDNTKSEHNLPQLFELGLGEPVSVSSIHNTGILELEAAVEKIFKKIKWQKDPVRKKKDARTQIAIVGKPNVGKSSLVNALLNKNRLIVSDIPGTTVDATDTPYHYMDHDYVLIDTAGLRRRGKAHEKVIERFAVVRSLQAISRADVVCLVLNYEEHIANQDLHVSEYILEGGKGLVIVVNKCDLMEDKIEDREKFLRTLHYRMSYMPWAPVIFVSALAKKNIHQVFELSKNIDVERRKQIPDKEFALFLKATVQGHPPTRMGHKLTIRNGSQTDVCPPTFTVYSNKPDLIHFSYRRFLENEIRRKFGFFGTVIKINVWEDER